MEERCHPSQSRKNLTTRLSRQITQVRRTSAFLPRASTTTFKSICPLPRTSKSITQFSKRCGITSFMSKEVRDFLFRALMFEADAAEFQQAGIQIGADTSRT